jgi:hypothetical protein
VSQFGHEGFRPEEDAAHNDTLKLAYVTGPLVFAKPGKLGTGELNGGQSVLLAIKAGKVASERGYVFTPEAQGWEQQSGYVQSIVKVSTKPPGFDFLAKITVSGSYNAHIYFEWSACADRLYLSGLQETEQRALRFEGQISNLV